MTNADGSGLTRLTDSPTDDETPSWSPDGTKVAFQRTGFGGEWDMWMMNSNGSGQTIFSDLAGSGLDWQSVPTLTVPAVSSVEGTAATVTVQLNREVAQPLTVTVATNGGTADDAPLISVDDVTVENLAPGIPATAVIAVRLNKPATQLVTVDYETADNTATGGVDYVRPRGRLTFQRGAQIATFEVRVTSDGDAVLVERFFVDLTDSVGGDLADAQGTVTLRDCVSVCEA